MDSWKNNYFLFVHLTILRILFIDIIKFDTIFNYYKLIFLTGKDKLGVPASEPVRVVLECDGTQIEDGEYFRTLANNTVLLLLRQGERWYPTGVDVIKAGEMSIK